jgi:uncharacterized protein (TIGR00299 family) protein
LTPVPVAGPVRFPVCSAPWITVDHSKEQPVRILHLDLTSGLGGDMLLAALADLGLDLAPFAALLDRAGLPIAISAPEQSVRGIGGRRLDLAFPPDQPLRHLHDLTGIVDRLELSPAVRDRAKAALARLAEAEAAVHCVPLDHVHFHEVGALDTLVDVVGAIWGIEALGVDEVRASALPWFGGFVDCDHGRIPLPAPATVKLLQGKPVFPTDIKAELVTPTGALLVDRLVDRFDAGPEGVVLATGTGYGTLDIPGHYNGLRAVLCETAEGSAGPHGEGERVERVWVLEANVDHLTGEELGAFFGALLDEGALDVAFAPAVMKKNRPGGMLQVICRAGDLARVQAAFFRHSLTLGLRRTLAERVVLPRRPATLQTPWGEVAAKQTLLDGHAVTRPEHDALLALARKTGRSVPELRHLLGHGNAVQGEE